MEIGIYFKFILSFVLILIAAKLGGVVAERYLKQPAVIGELVAGVIISPFALGGLIFGSDPIILNFAQIPLDSLSSWGLSGEGNFSVMEVISEIGVIVLLFVAGVETDVRSFLKQGKLGTLVAAGGVILPFIFGFLMVMAFFPEAPNTARLFMGAILVATSIGITVRILMDMGQLHTRAGTTILVAAVIDDIIGIVVLSVVASMAQTGAVDAWRVAYIVVGGFGIWLLLLVVGVRFNRYISKIFLNPFKSSGAMPIVALLIGFLIAYLVTLVDLHPVVGAYVAGLMFSACAEKEEIVQKTRPIMLFLAPFFFCYLGMQVDLGAMAPVAAFAAVLVVLAIIGKMIGCYLPSKFVGKFSNNEAMIVGVGMVPRGEVGLIVAGVGLLIPGALGTGDMPRELFGAAVAVSLFTTLLTPLMLKPFFRRSVKTGT